MADVDVRKDSVAADLEALTQKAADRMERCQNQIIAELDSCKGDLQGSQEYVKLLIWVSSEVTSRIGQAVGKP